MVQEFSSQIYKNIFDLLEKGVLPNLKIEGDIAYTIDPVYGLKRNRVNAECAKTLIRVNKLSGNNYTGLVEKILNYLVWRQNSDGSWNEIHMNENSPSALITSIVGEALIDGYVSLQKEELKVPITAARNFVLDNEVSDGYFRKSFAYSYQDYLNVDATCGAFLAKYGKTFSDNECLKAAERVAKHIFEYQFSDGSFPYVIKENENEINYLKVPCIHYQGVTIYYLLKIQEALNLKWTDSDLKSAIKWLASVQYSNGKFDWSKSGLMFAYYLSGAYAFAIPCFMYGARWNRDYILNSQKAIGILSSNIKDLANRWERATMWSFLPSIFITLHTVNIGTYPLKHRLFRFGYGMYRQFARRRFSGTVNPRLFNLLSSFMCIKASTVEPENNFPDLFMTSEILDCLSYSLMLNGEIL